MTKMNDFDFVIAHMLESASQLDDSGKVVTASRIDEHVQRIVTAGYGGGIAEYISKLLELARNKGIDYMQSRMQEERIVTLNDGTPVLKQNDAPWLINAVVARARSLKLPETKGMKPFAPGKKGSGWSDEASKRLEEIKSGKSSWLNQTKPFSDAMEEKKRKKLKWEPPAAKSENPASEKPVAKPASATSNPAQSVAKPASAPKSTGAPKKKSTSTPNKEVYFGSQDMTPRKKEMYFGSQDMTPRKKEMYFGSQDMTPRKKEIHFGSQDMDSSPPEK